MTTPEQPKQTESVYAAELRRRGFTEMGRPKRLKDDDQMEELKEKYDVVILGHDPFFLYLGGKARTTYAMDDTGMFWKIEGFIDLTDLGFEEQKPPKGGEYEPSVH